MEPLPTPHLVWSQIQPHIAATECHQVALQDALGRVLAAPIEAHWDYPRADVSAMDGYAYRGDHQPGAQLKVIGEVAAGAPFAEVVESGCAVAIMTGAWLPEGTDRVVPVEQTTLLNDSTVTIQVPTVRGAHIRRQAEVHSAGQSLVASPTRLNPIHLSMAAGEGRTTVRAFSKPKVGTLITGNEVVTASGSAPIELTAGTIADSHTPLLHGMLDGLGIEPVALGVVGDQMKTLRSSLDQTADLDLVITTGGVSAGRYDLIPEALTSVGFTISHHKVAMQPGKPILIARRQRQWAIGLPGNPAAVLVGFHVFVLPLLKALEGDNDVWDQVRIQQQLSSPIYPHREKTRYLPAHSDDRGRSRVTVPIGSHHLAAFASAPCLLEIPPGETAMDIGTSVSSIRILGLSC